MIRFLVWFPVCKGPGKMLVLYRVERARCSHGRHASAPRRDFTGQSGGWAGREHFPTTSITRSFTAGTGSRVWSFKRWGIGMSHYVTFHVTSGSYLFMNPSLSFKLQVLTPPTPMSPSTEIQDIKQPFRLHFLRTSQREGHYFLLEPFYVALLLLLAF